MQNLTARYNYLYNANLILNDYTSRLHEGYADNFTETLPVFIGPEKFDPEKNVTSSPENSKDLDAIIDKAQTLIADKSKSNYIDDAYMLLGKAYFYKANYFIAAEYFDYAAKTYGKNKDILVTALNWKARCYMQLNNLHTAAGIMDTVEHFLDSIKHHRSAPLASLAQLSLDLNRQKEAIAYLESARKKNENSNDRIRWTYILAQLYEARKDYEPALKYYKQVKKSNANFDLYFNASLNFIKISAALNPHAKSKTTQMLALLKDDKNEAYLDQVYYQIAEMYAQEQLYPKANDFYIKSAQSSLKNPYQKGMAYLKLADLNFNYFKDYIKAKSYYDSTVVTLPKNHPQYNQILKKTSNLQYLTDRFQRIALQDTLQALAKLPVSEQLKEVQAMFLKKAPVQETFITPQNVQRSADVFNQGIDDFRKKWGNRKEEDNWRQSIRTSGETNTLKAVQPGIADELSAANRVPAIQNDSSAIQNYLADIPVNAEQLHVSNQKIIDAYFQAASFYQQELNDPAEAIRIYQILLNRFPENNYLPAIQYSLYLAYQNSDKEKASAYKNALLSKYPESIYAKTLLDPGYSQKQSDNEVQLNNSYNDLFSSYQAKDFHAVIQAQPELLSRFPNNYLAPQFDYLKAIAIGRTQPVDSLILAFKKIKSQYPADKLIIPLVNNHLDYISQHYAEFKRRAIALTDFDPNESPFTPRSQEDTALLLPKTIESAEPPAKTSPAETISPSPLFSIKTSGTYYFVVDVADASLTLSSSRFGIGQFNRGHYAEQALRHQLIEFDDDQLIYVGNFSSFEDVKEYAAGIVPQLSRIMKVPGSKYSTFIISKENFEKLKSKVLVNQYLEFYKNNY